MHCDGTCAVDLPNPNPNRNPNPNPNLNPNPDPNRAVDVAAAAGLGRAARALDVRVGLAAHVEGEERVGAVERLAPKRRVPVLITRHRRGRMHTIVPVVRVRVRVT